MEIDPLAVVTSIDGVANELRSLRESVDGLERMLFEKLGGMSMDNLNVTVFNDSNKDVDALNVRLVENKKEEK
jgi:hypothetical protein